MDRRHLRAEDGVVFPHFFREDRFLDRGRKNLAYRLFPVMCTEGSEQRADTDSGSAEVVDLIDLQAGINLAASGQNLINLIGGNGVETAAEGVELYEFKSRIDRRVSLHSLQLHTDGCGTSTGH